MILSVFFNPIKQAFFALLFLLPFVINGQSEIKGKITDVKSAEDLIGATVKIKGTSSGGITDINGEFKITTSQKLSEALIVHPYHTAIVGGDSLVLERTDFSARIAYVDYDGAKVYDAYLAQTPKTHSERTEFVQNNAPKVVAGLTMIEKFFEALKRDAVDELMLMKNNLKIPN